MNKQSDQHNFLDCLEAEEIAFLAAIKFRDHKQIARLSELLDTTPQIHPTPDIWYLKAKLAWSRSPGGFKDLTDSYRFDLEFKRTCLQKALELDPAHVRSQLFVRYLDNIQNRVRPKYWYLFLFHRRGFPVNLDFSYISPGFVFQPKKTPTGIGSVVPLSVRNTFLKALDEEGAFWFRSFQNMLFVQG